MPTTFFSSVLFFSVCSAEFADEMKEQGNCRSDNQNCIHTMHDLYAFIWMQTLETLFEWLTANKWQFQCNEQKEEEERNTFITRLLATREKITCKKKKKNSTKTWHATNYKCTIIIRIRLVQCRWKEANWVSTRLLPKNEKNKI